MNRLRFQGRQCWVSKGSRNSPLHDAHDDGLGLKGAALAPAACLMVLPKHVHETSLPSGVVIQRMASIPEVPSG